MADKDAHVLRGDFQVISWSDKAYPESLRATNEPPQKLYVCGNTDALQMGLAVVGARKATPYGKSCATRFAGRAAEKGVVVISGGARGCDVCAHEAALARNAPTVVVLGGGLDRLYPAQHKSLFQKTVDQGGAVVSEYPWDTPARPFQFRRRNRIIAGLARATLIVEAGLPSGTFTTADEALGAGREVLVVPGAITADTSRGSNRLLFQGATPIVDDETFDEILFTLFGCLRQQGDGEQQKFDCSKTVASLAHILQAAPYSLDEVFSYWRDFPETRRQLDGEGFGSLQAKLMHDLLAGEQEGLFARYPDGRWGPA